MSKRCPSCGYSPIGPFIDNCPICAEPVRNVRGGSGRPGSPPPWLWWIIGGAGVAVIAVAGCCGYGMWQMNTLVQDAKDAMAKMEAERQARTVVVTAAELIKDFQDDPAAADIKYAGKYLVLTGVVERTGRGRHDSPFVVLHGGDDTVKVKIECFFDLWDQPTEGRVRRLNNGQTITLRGEYDGRVSNVQLRECILDQ